MAKYYQRIKDLERLEDNKPADRRAIDDTEFDFDRLKATGFAGKLLAKLIQQRWLYFILRTFFPVLKIGGIYFVTRYQDVKYVRENDALFEAPYGPEMDRLTGGAGFLLGMRRGPEYDRQLNYIMHGSAGQPAAFQADDLTKIVKPQAERAAEQLIKAAAGEFDVIEDYLNRIAVETCCHHYGLEPEDPNAFARWLMSLSALLFADYNGSETYRTLAMAGAKRIHPVTTTAIEQARFCLSKPDEAIAQHGQAYCDWIKNTVIGRLVAQQVASSNTLPSDDDIRGMIMGLSVGFVPTGAGGGGGILEVLLKNDGAMARAKAAALKAKDGDEAPLEAILLEAMRFKPPILPGLPRYVVDDPDLSKKIGRNRRVDKIPKGATILAAAFSAMFDGRKFGGSIKRFDETRDLSMEDLSFGGADLLHYCIGEQIFRVMITTAFKHLLLCDDLKPATGDAGKMERTGPFPVHMKMTFAAEAGERKQSMLTICLPLERPDDTARINRWLDALGNPADGPAREALLKSPRLHFAQMTAISDEARDIPANLLVELNADGTPEDIIESFVDCLWHVDPFQQIMSEALGLNEATPKRVKAGLLKHNYTLDISPLAASDSKTMGLNFFGLPEQSVPLVEEERTLADTARGHLSSFLEQSLQSAAPARDAVTYMRRQLKHSSDTTLGAALMRPVQKDPSVSRRPTLELNETLSLLLKDGGFLVTVLGGMAIWALAYLLFLQGGISSSLSWSAIGGLLINGLHIFGAFLVARAFHWLRLRLFAKSDLEKTGLLLGWSIATTLAYIVVTKYGIWGPDAFATVDTPDYWHRTLVLLGLAWKALLAAFFGLLLWGAFVFASLFYFRNLLQASEDGSPPEDTDLALKKYQEVMQRENQPDHAQNHIVFVTPLKDNPSWLRRVTMFIGFYFIKTLVLYRFRKGFVLDLGTIHFARWFILPKSHTMIFYSNYDGSGESYFEDFVTKARWGQTGVWSNGKGFPKTVDLLFEGAKDATRFKRWIRHHQQVTRFWFARFKDLSTRDIRRNAMICEGLAKAKTDSEYRALIDLMTSGTRPGSTLETNEIQSLVLRGMGNLNQAEMIALKFPDPGQDGNQALAKWLADLSGKSSKPNYQPAKFDTRSAAPETHAVNVALSPSGLERLRLREIHHVHKGLPSDAYASLPAAFKSGMASEDRKLILGDRNHDEWEWGAQQEPDAVLILYADKDTDLDAVVTREKEKLETAGFGIVTQIKTKPLEFPLRETFGFLDGISQPVIKGTAASLAPQNALHTVEPGEFVLGYKDNTEYYPSSPMVNALAPGAAGLPSLPEHALDDFPAFGTDPEISPRDLGKNGSFLVIRQLEQDKDGFSKHLKTKAEEARTAYGLDHITEDWLGAKLMGRWKTDGSSIVHHPDKPNGKADFDPAKDDNAFRFGTEDPQGLNCPYGAHIRRANPRDSQKPGEDTQIELSNRHRLLRRGRVYENDGKAGLLFMCLNANLERQFEFVQQTWLNATRFHGLQNEYDSIAGDSAHTPNKFTIPTASGPIEINNLQSFVTVRGGGYFFLPSKSALRFLSVLVVS